ncbi:MAG: amidohydrolase/deacetylase family metallohydrolase [Firmicutes bacterium]|nr:amidohydrolase/deacetylase family metallohydrolase [Bacillota bacterium]
MTFDLVVSGGRLVGGGAPLAGAHADIGVAGGRIAAVGDLAGAEAKVRLEAAGWYVSAGWIDLHVHLGPGFGQGEGLDPDADAGVATGVTTAVDAGTVGAAEYEAWAERVARPSATRLLAFLNISADTRRRPVHGDVANLDVRRAVDLLRADAGGRLVGVKVLASQSHCGPAGFLPVERAVEAARQSGTRVMAHIGHAPPALAEVLARLEEGDIVTHAWHGKPGGVLDEVGEVRAAVRQALARGVRFDLGHGSASFSFAVAARARAAGMPLATASTDLHRPNHAAGPVFDLATTMSKLLHVGYGLAEVVDMVTVRAAESLGREGELGRVAVGREADLTLFEVVEGDWAVRDAEGEEAHLTRRILPRRTVRAGRLFPCRDVPAGGEGCAPG